MNRDKLSLALLLFLLFFSLCFLTPEVLFLHFDIGWHLELGNIIRTTGIIPDTDPWSSTAKGHSFLHWYWLWDILASFLFESTGDFSWLFIFTAVQVGLLVAVVGLNLRSRGCSGLLAFLVATFFGISWFICSANVPSATISARLTSFLFFAITMLVLHRAVDKGHSREMWLLAPLIGVWGNTHRLATLAIPALALYFFQCVIQKNWRVAGAIAGTTVSGFLLVAFLHPMHLEAYKLFTLTSGDPSYSWGSIAYNFAESSSAKYLTAFLALAWFTRARPPLAEGVHTFLWLILGLKVSDAFPLFLITSAPVLGTMIHDLVSSFSIATKVQEAFTEMLSSRAICAALVIATLSAVGLSPRYLNQEYPSGMNYPAQFYPHKGLEFLQAHYNGRRLLTDWNFGGFIIHKTHGQLPVWVDGRSSNAYSMEVMADAMKLDTQPAEILKKYDIEITFLRNQVPANLYLSGNPEWKLIYKDELASIFERL